MMELDLSTAPQGHRVIRPTGRLNMISAKHLVAAVGAELEAGNKQIVVDLSATEFMDSSGLGALVSSLKRARQADGDLRIACPTAQIQAVLELTNLDRVLRPRTSVEGAFDAE